MNALSQYVCVPSGGRFEESLLFPPYSSTLERESGDNEKWEEESPPPCAYSPPRWKMSPRQRRIREE